LESVPTTENLGRFWDGFEKEANSMRSEPTVEHHWETFKIRQELDSVKVQRSLLAIAALIGWAIAVVMALRGCD
jgi:hypothetical protein